MRLGTKLMLAFLLLAVLPLTWITLYSYNSSITAFRGAVEAESGALADEMGARMDSLRRELAFRVEHLGRFPFQQLMGMRDPKANPQSNALMSELMTEMGDAASLVDSIEFRSAQMKLPQPGGPSAGPVRSQTPPGPEVALPKELQGLVIHLDPESPAAPSPPPAAAGSQDQVIMHIRPSFTPPPVPRPEPGSPALAGKGQQAADEARQPRADRLKQIREFQVFLEQLGVGIDRQRGGGPAGMTAERERKSGAQSARPQRSNPLGSDFGVEVRTEGNTVGTVRARVSSGQVYRNIMSRGRRRQGEIPFIIDADDKVHTLNDADGKRLEALALPGTSSEAAAKAALPALKDWVVVTRKDEGSNVTFGIARPISEPLKGIRNTAVRNLGFGLGVVGLALIGIIPLSNRMTRNLAALARGAEQLAQGNLDARVSVHSRDEIGRLAESFNRMAHDLNENQKHLVERERMRKELEMSRRIQEELLPKLPLQDGMVEVKGVSIPAQEVGGDFFNYFPLPDGEVAILVGDVSGKGIAAALLMANLQATLQARLPLAPELAQLARQLDKEIASSTPQEVYLTLFMGILNPRENLLRYVNAGHNPQFVLHGDRGIERLESTGRPLGLLPGGTYEERRVPLAEGAALFLYTDGLVEAVDGTDREFGQERLEKLLLEAHSSSVNEILIRVEQEIRDYRGAVDAADDATMLILKFGA